MANKYVIQLEVDQSGVVQHVDTVEKKFEQVANSTNSVNQELRELQKQLSTLDQGSAEFQKLAKRAGELKDRLNDAAEAARNNAGNAFEVLGNNTRNLKDQVLNLDFEGVATSLRGIAGAAGNVKFSDLTSGIKTLGSSFAALGKALLTNPLFLIITGVTLLIANFDKLTAALDGVTDAQVESAEAAQKASDAAKEQYDWVSANENTLKLQGKSEKEITALKKEQLDLAIAQQAAAIEQQRIILETQIQAAERNNKILTGILDFLSAPLRVITETIDYIGKAVGQDFGLSQKLKDFNAGVASLVFNPEEMRAEGEATLKEAQKNLDALTNTRAGIILGEQKANADAAKARQEALLQEKLAIAKQLEDIAKLQQALSTRILSDIGGAESSKSKLLSANDERYKILEQQQALELQLMKDGQDKEIALVDQKYIALREQAAGNAELTKQLAEQNEADVQAIKQKYEDQERQRKINNIQTQLSIASEGLQLLSALNDLSSKKDDASQKKAFERNKAIQIGNTIISTASAVMAQLAVPQDALTGANFVKAGIAAALGAAQIAKIAQTKYQSTGGGGGSVGSGTPAVGNAAPAQGAPQFNPVNTDFVGNRPEQQVARSYVLASDVATNVEARRRIDQQARLG